jgi:hypothetical protein
MQHLVKLKLFDIHLLSVNQSFFHVTFDQTPKRLNTVKLRCVRWNKMGRNVVVKKCLLYEKCMMCSVIVEDQMNGIMYWYFRESTELFDEIIRAKLICSLCLLEESTRKTFSYSTINRHIFASVFVDYKRNWIFGVLPGFSWAQPHVERRFIKVYYVFLCMD